MLYFVDCANWRQTRALLEHVSSELHVDVDLRLVEVADPDSAAELHFLGSPTVRVDGRDVEPGADARTDYVYACRVYNTLAGLSGQPDERWLAAALTEED